MLPGTELAFEQNVKYDNRWIWTRTSGFRVGKFNIIDPHFRERHHDAIEFPDGSYVLVTQLCTGQRATVLQLPVVHPVAERDSRRRLRPSPGGIGFPPVEFAVDVRSSGGDPTPPPERRLPTAWHRRARRRRRGARMVVSASPIVCDRRRPRPVDPLWLDGIDGKAVAAPPQRQRALPPQTLGIDHRSRAGCGRRTRGHDQRGAFAIVASASGRSASATKRRRQLCVTQPLASQDTPSASEASVAVRASASAASHSLTRKRIPWPRASDAAFRLGRGRRHCGRRRRSEYPAAAPASPRPPRPAARPRRTSAAASATGRAG